MKKCGYIAILGRTNAGKSTLLNKLIGQKISIVSPKKQTTRENILGILTHPDCQYIFVDTPGIHKSKNALDKLMSKEIRSASEGVDAILYLIDISKKIDEEEINFLKNLVDKNSESNNLNLPIFVLLTKTDISSKEKAYPEMEKLNGINFSDIIPISTFKNKNLDIVLEKLKNVLPEVSAFYFEEDEITDKSINYLITEIIREKTLYLLNEEIPHGIAVKLNYFNEENFEMSADIVCEKDSHKSIIVGKRGDMI
ncbi:MAG: GTPase Era, partial [Clostridia bacterium]|nr:GTPase Era [Clostridia bacterium]